MMFSFSENLNDYYHEFYDIRYSFHDHDRDYVLVNVHGFGMISHSF